jgi:hypothetical protein
MAAKKKISSLGPKVGKLLEQALLEALKRHYGKSQSHRTKKKAPVRKKKAPGRKKKAGKKKPVRRRARRT